MTETGRCNKCDSEISVNAERCPECGYEPGAGSTLGTILGSIGILIGGPIVAFGVLMLVIIPILMIFEGFAVRSGIILMLFFGAMALIPLLVAALAGSLAGLDEERTPVDD